MNPTVQSKNPSSTEGQRQRTNSSRGRNGQSNFGRNCNVAIDPNAKSMVDLGVQLHGATFGLRNLLSDQMGITILPTTNRFCMVLILDLIHPWLFS